MDLKQFSEQFGVSLVVATTNTTIKLERSSPTQEDVKALSNLATRLIGQGVRPQSAVFEVNYRSMGVFPFLETLSVAMGEKVKEIVHASVRHPGYYYPDLGLIKDEMSQHGMRVIHRYLSAEKVHTNMWTESPESLEKHLELAFTRKFPEPAVLLVPVEGMILWFYTKVVGIRRVGIPSDESVWLPKLGSIIVFSRDRKVVAEFDADLNRVEAAPT